jgi:adenylate kinase
MIIAVTGTPGTGKTAVSRKLSGMTGMRLVELNSLAEKKGLYKGTDRKRGCKIVDIPGLRRVVKALDEDGGALIVESHYAHDMPADAIVVLRASPAKIRERGRAKGWGAEKAEENVEAEIMEVCRSEALARARGKGVIEVDTTGKDAGEAAAEVASMLQKRGMLVFRDLKINEAMRKSLAKPYGKFFGSIEKSMGYVKGTQMLSVGDQVSRALLSAGMMPDITVVDGKINRIPVKSGLKLRCRTIRARNRSGTITGGLWRAAGEAVISRKPVKVEVEGEEDIAVLPLMLLAKDGASIIYGLFGKGVCVIKTGPASRKTASGIVREIASAQ